MHAVVLNDSPKMSQKRKEVTVEIRKLILKLRIEGKSMAIIAETVGLVKSTVQTIIENFNNTGSYRSKSRFGRPTKLTERNRRRIICEVTAKPKISANILAENIYNTSQIRVHPETIRRCIRREGYHSRIPRRKPFISLVNKAKRLAFAKKYYKIHEQDANFWNRVIFTDECKFNVFSKDGRAKVWRKPNTEMLLKNLTPTVKHGSGSVMVWGCMAGNGVGELHFIEGIMDKFVYLDILKTNFTASVEKLGLSANYIFQHDNDPKHTSGLVREWLLYHVRNQLNSPPQSPDLNVIEHLWDELKRRVRKREVYNKEQLKKILMEEWVNITPDVTEKLVSSMPRRLEAVIEYEGGPTSY